MSISVNNNQAIIDHLGSGVTWEPNQGVTVEGGNYGQILTVETNETGALVVTTENGVLTFGVDAPQLDEAEETFAPYELAQTGFEEFDGFNWLEIAALVLQAENLRRNTSRLIRQDARESAFSHAMNAAKELMKGALTNMVMGCVAGGISIAGGLFSLKSSIGSTKNTQQANQDVKMAQTEAKMAKTQAELSQTRADIADLEAKPQPLSTTDQAKLDGLKTREQQLVTQRDKQFDELTVDIEKTEADLKKTNEKFEANQEKIDENNDKIAEIDDKLNDPNSDLEYSERTQLEADKMQLQRENTSLQKDQQHLADKAELLNDKLTKLEGIQQKAIEFEDDANGICAPEAKEWAEQADANLKAAEVNLNTVMAESQRDVQIAGAWQSLASAAAQLLNTIGGYFEAQGQADAKIEDAYATQDQFAQDDASQDLQSANEAIRNFKEAWQKFLDTIKQAEDRLVQA